MQSVPLYHSIGTIVLLFLPIHWLFSRMGCYYGSKIIPSFFVDKASCTRQFESELSLHSLASLFPIKEGSTFLTKPLFPQEREDVTALRCSEPLRYKVGGPSKVYAKLCGLGPPGEEFSIASCS